MSETRKCPRCGEEHEVTIVLGLPALECPAMGAGELVIRTTAGEGDEIRVVGLSPR